MDIHISTYTQIFYCIDGANPKIGLKKYHGSTYRSYQRSCVRSSTCFLVAGLVFKSLWIHMTICLFYILCGYSLPPRNEPETNVRPRVHLGELNGNTLTLHQSEGSGTPSLVQLQLNENLSNPRAGIVFWKAVVVTDADDNTSLVGDQWATWIGKTY